MADNWYIIVHKATVLPMIGSRAYDLESEARSRILELGEYAPAYEVVEVQKVGTPALNRKSWYINIKCHDGKPSETMRVWSNREDAVKERDRFVGGTTFDVVEIQATN